MDWIGNNLYWTNDGYRKTISVARLEKAAQIRKTLLEGDMTHPRAIVVDPLNRYACLFHWKYNTNLDQIEISYINLTIHIWIKFKAIRQSFFKSN